LTKTVDIDPGVEQKDRDRRLDDLVINVRGELEQLRKEIESYRVILNSARLILGHEFIKPLTSISGYMELIENRIGDSNDEKVSGYFEKTGKAVERMGGLVEAFVNILQFEEDEFKGYNLESVDIRDLIEDIKSRFEQYHHIIHNKIKEDFPLCILNRSCLDIVLENLISNAIKQRSDDTEVTISASRFRDRRGSSNGEILLLRVEDNGEGMSQSEVDRILDPLYQDNDKKNISGVGPDLALVKSVLTVMGGDISVKSKPGEGTKVSLALPLTPESVLR
jgi:signal transduction histidine kinase